MSTMQMVSTVHCRWKACGARGRLDRVQCRWKGSTMQVGRLDGVQCKWKRLKYYTGEGWMEYNADGKG